METQHWLETALDCGYIDQKTRTQLADKCLEIGRMLGGMMEKSDLFCNTSPHISETPAEYLIETNN